MIAVAISGMAALAISNTYNNYIQQKFAIESKGLAVSDIETAAKFIRTIFPNLINNTAGADGKIPLPAGWWNCPPNSNCSLTAFTTTDNTVTTAPNQQVMSVECRQITNAALAASNIHTMAIDDTKPNNCVQCPQGSLPILSVAVMNPGTVDAAPTANRNIVFPSNDNLGPGTIATGVCFNADGYDYNQGTAAEPQIIKLYNRWTITLNAIYLNAQLPSDASVSTVNNMLRKVTERIMVSPPQQLGPNINYIPTR